MLGAYGTVLLPSEVVLPDVVESLLRVIDGAAWQGVGFGGSLVVGHALCCGDAMKPMRVESRGWRGRGHHAPVQFRRSDVVLEQCAVCKLGAGSLVGSGPAFTCSCGCQQVVCSACVMGTRTPEKRTRAAGFALGCLARALFTSAGSAAGSAAAVAAFVAARGCPRLCAAHTAVCGSAAKQCWGALVMTDAGCGSTLHFGSVAEWPAVFGQCARMVNASTLVDLCVMICALEYACSAARMAPAAVWKLRQQCRSCLGAIADAVGELLATLTATESLRLCAFAIDVLLLWAVESDGAGALSVTAGSGASGGAPGTPSGTPGGSVSMLAARLKAKSTGAKSVMSPTSAAADGAAVLGLVSLLRSLSPAGVSAIAAAVSVRVRAWTCTPGGAAFAYAPERVRLALAAEAAANFLCASRGSRGLELFAGNLGVRCVDISPGVVESVISQCPLDDAVPCVVFTVDADCGRALEVGVMTQPPDARFELCIRSNGDVACAEHGSAAARVLGAVLTGVPIAVSVARGDIQVRVFESAKVVVGVPEGAKLYCFVRCFAVGQVVRAQFGRLELERPRIEEACGPDLLAACVRQRWSAAESVLCLPLACMGRTEVNSNSDLACIISCLADVAGHADVLFEVCRSAH